jgi:hypothetical protein
MFRNGVLLALILAGCSAGNGSPNQIAATENSPELGPLQTFTGVWSLEFEMSIFSYCTQGVKNCVTAMFDSNGCWLSGLGERPGQLEKLIGGRVNEGDKLYVKFKGRETSKRGKYGHLGEYSCEIYGEELISAERIDLKILEGN